MNQASLGILLRSVNLPAFALHYEQAAERASAEGWEPTFFLRHLLELEIENRRVRRIERLVKGSHLPSGKTLSTLDIARFPQKVQRQLPTLIQGHFVDRAENVLAFGLPGRGKTHLISAIGHELVQRGRSVLFTPAYKLVQSLLVAKRNLALEREMRRLDRFEAVIIDDIGYVQQQAEEMEVLFTFMAERYERKSVIITSNLVFSQWDKIFKDPMTTAAAIDRLVHHCTILELTGPSYRAEHALGNNHKVHPKEETQQKVTPPGGVRVGE
jgi:DNA replication protein DnaC